MARVLVTGAHGLLGSSLVPHLRGTGVEIVTHSRRAECRSDVHGELLGRETAVGIVEAVQPDVIVNLAALTDVDACERDPNAAYQANVLVVQRLTDAIRQTSARTHLIQISTDQVYDGVGKHVEGDVTLTNYYGFSKYASEIATLGVGGTVLRTNFFGHSLCPGRSSISDWIISACRSGRAVTVFDDVHFSPLSLSTLVMMIERVIETPLAGVYNLGSTGGLTKADFAFQIAAQLGLPAPLMTRGSVTSVKLSAYRPKDMRMNSSLFERTFGVELPTLATEIGTLREPRAHATG